MTRSWLVHNLVSTFSWLCTTYSWLVQNLFTTYSQTFTTCSGLVKDFFKTCSHFSHVLFRTSFEPLHDLFIIGSQLGHNLFMICSCSKYLHDLFTTCSQIVHVLLKKFFDSMISLESDEMTGLWSNDSLTFPFYGTFSISVPDWTTFVKEVFWFHT